MADHSPPPTMLSPSDLPHAPIMLCFACIKSLRGSSSATFSRSFPTRDAKSPLYVLRLRITNKLQPAIYAHGTIRCHSNHNDHLIITAFIQVADVAFVRHRYRSKKSELTSFAPPPTLSTNGMRDMRQSKTPAPARQSGSTNSRAG